MKSRTEAMRALAYVVAGMIDTAHHHADEMTRARMQAWVDLLVPVVKGWCTETAIDVASLGIQIHGGMGFIEETGAAQHLRDARITSIYEGTTGIQANDLVGRKILRENGQTIRALMEHIKSLYDELGKAPGENFTVIRRRLADGVEALADAVDWIVATGAKDINAVLAGAVPFLHLCGVVCGGWQLARAALIAQDKLRAGEGDATFYQAKIVTARFFADHVLSQARGLSDTTVHGAAGVMALAEEQF
jgi:3-(methylthio)propanoyl-CoA dehydrogenase